MNETSKNINKRNKIHETNEKYLKTYVRLKTLKTCDINPHISECKAAGTFERWQSMYKEETRVQKDGQTRRQNFVGCLGRQFQQ